MNTTNLFEGKEPKTKGKFLVVIPCHSDMNEALIQARELRKQFNSNSSQDILFHIQLKLLLLVNAHTPTHEEMSEAELEFDKVIYFGENWLADVNISQGFIAALEEKPEYLWILSANDHINPNAWMNIVEILLKSDRIDLLVTNVLNSDCELEVKDLLNPPPDGLCFGNISGVIYKCDPFISHFSSGPFLAWTGWSHLAVIQSAMKESSVAGLRVRTIPAAELYEEGLRDFSTIGRYGYSVYGFLILGWLFCSSSREKKDFLRSFIYVRKYDWNLYSSDWKFGSSLIEKNGYLGWNQLVAEGLIKSYTPFTYLAYLVLKRIPFIKIVRTIRNLSDAFFTTGFWKRQKNSQL